MSTEKQMWDYMRPRLAPYGRTVRVENPAMPGTPDVYYRFRLPGTGIVFGGWIELKHLDEPAKLPDTPLKFERFTLDQVMWLEDEEHIAGRAHLLIRCGRAYTLVKPAIARMIYEEKLSYHGTVRRSIYHSDQYFSPAELVRCLKGR